ncbi:anti-sigma factor [Portibacter marinus]|uniref:anti-sigma factor n=1 Tax=Portibacter marinus TaxID=2898660 RepID=UPI001F2843DE|nr:anti-sigma factor [Portibacter marinus]
MNLEEIRNSGLLESYVIGLLSGRQLAEVESHLKEYPELNSDLSEIQRAFRAYAESNGVEPRAAFRSELIREITGKNPSSPRTNQKGGGRGPYFLPFLIFAALAIGGIWWGYNNLDDFETLEGQYTALNDEYTDYQSVCDSISADNAELRAMMNTITNPGNRIIQLTPTGNFAATNLYLHTNAELQLNYIQALALPSIAANQAFQLWSLKEEQDPIPLTVFANAENQIIPVDFEEGTATYAITIEDAAGAQVPNLNQLIGTIGV